MNTSTKLVTLFNETIEGYFNGYIDDTSRKIKLKYKFNFIKGKCYKLTIKFKFHIVIDRTIIILFDKLLGITYDSNFIKIKTLYYNQLEEHTLFNYEPIDADINENWIWNWLRLKPILIETNTNLIKVLEKIIDEEVVEKTEYTEPDLLDVENEEEIHI